MKDLEHIKFLDRVLNRGGDVLEKVESYVKYLKYTETYDETSENFKKLFEPTILSVILNGNTTFLDAYSALLKADFSKLNELKDSSVIQTTSSACGSQSSSCHSSSSSRCGSSSTSCHSSRRSSHKCGSSSGGCHSSSSSRC